MLLYFVRHGQTDDNANGIIQGHKDTHLNDHGRLEASLVAKRLKDVPLSQVWTSELSRARETAEIILAHHPQVHLQSHPDLKERCLGSMEGKRWKRDAARPDDIEPSDRFQKRVCNWVFSFLDSYHADIALNELGPATSSAPVEPSDLAALLGGIHLDKYDPDEPIVLVVSHGAWMSALYRTLPWFPFTFPPEDQLKSDCYNTSLMVLRCWKSNPVDVERRKREFKDAMKRYRADKEAHAKEELASKHNKILAGMSHLLSKGDGQRNGETAHGPRPPRRIVEMGWDGELLSWGDISHLDELRKRDEEEGKGARDRQAAKVADDIKG